VELAFRRLGMVFGTFRRPALRTKRRGEEQGDFEPQPEIRTTITIRERRFAELDRLIAAGVGEARRGRPRMSQ
jgi:hypothetical protein